MGGIIAGFLGGASNAAAEGGKMMLADKLSKEREEANFLRESELRTTMAKTRMEFDEGQTTRQLESREGIATEGITSKEKEGRLDRDSAEKIAQIRADASSTSTATTGVRDATYLMNQGYPKDVANAVAHGAYKTIKDADTNDMVVVNTLNNQELGRLTTVDGQKTWIPTGEQTANAAVTSKHRKSAKEAASEKASIFNFDSTDFPGGRKEWIAQEAQRIANEEREAKNKQKNIPIDATVPPGSVASQMDAPATDQDVDLTADAITEPTKKVNGVDTTKDSFIDQMVGRYGESKRNEIEKVWDSLP